MKKHYGLCKIEKNTATKKHTHTHPPTLSPPPHTRTQTHTHTHPLNQTTVASIPHQLLVNSEEPGLMFIGCYIDLINYCYGI